MSVAKYRMWDGKKMYQNHEIKNNGLGVLQGTSYKMMQFTGLLDKQGVEIYEGDIQKETVGQHYAIYVVKSSYGFGNSLFSMQVKDNYSINEEGTFTFNERILKNEIRSYIKNGDGVEVIGNIYENSNLLE